MLLAMSTSVAHACRCDERTLAEYYADADTVLMATIESVQAVFAADTRLNQVYFQTLESAWKSALQRPARKQFRTGTSSASCALEARAGDVWLLFLPQNEEELVNSCGGSRALHNAAGNVTEPASGRFVDVPARFVASQLNALAGLDLLRDLQASDSARLLGLLDINTLSHGGSALIHADATASAAVIASISNMDQLQSREASYEFAAAAIYATSDFGYRVKLQDGRTGWLAREHAGTWFPYPGLIVNRLNHLNGDWHGFLWPHAGAGIPYRLAGKNDFGRAHAARVNAVTKVADSLWLQVDVLRNNGCEDKPVTVIASGWTPAWLANGEPAAWFYSRGC